MPNPYIHAPSHVPGGGDPLFNLIPGAGTPGSFLGSNGLYIPLATKGVSYTYRGDDFPSIPGSPFMATNSGGTGAASGLTQFNAGDHQGICQLFPGATAGADARLSYPYAFLYPRPLATYVVQSVVNFRDFVAGDTNQYFVGFASLPGSPLSTVEFYVGFYFNVSVSPNLLTYTRNSAILTQNDTGIAVVQNSWVMLTVAWAYNQVLFYVNGVQVDQRADSSVTTGSFGLIPVVFENTAALTVSRNFYADTMEVLIDPGIADRFMMGSV